MIELIQTQFPFGKPIPAYPKTFNSGLTIIIITSALLIGGALFYIHISNKKNEPK
jgi:hypothetical protein